MTKRSYFFMAAWASILWILFKAEDPSALAFELFINISFVVFMVVMVNILHDAFTKHKMKPETTSIDGASEVELAPKTQEKVIKVAAEICRMHAKTAGARECQDWSNTNIDPSKLFTEQEQKDLLYNFEQHNSGVTDYDEGCLRGMGDEMVMSFVISRNLELMVDHKHNHTEATK